MLPVSSGGYQDDYSNKINDGESHNVPFFLVIFRSQALQIDG